MEEGVVEVSKSGLLLEDVCYVFEKERRRKAVFAVCEDEVEKADVVDLLVERRVEVEAIFCQGDGVLE